MRGNMFIAVVCVLVATCFGAPAPIAAQEFIRGDLNSDGVASTGCPARIESSGFSAVS